MSRRRQLTSVVLSIGLIAAIIGLSRTVPDPEYKYGAIASSGDIKEKVTTEAFGVTVHKIELAKTVVIKEPFQKPEKLPTPGMWLVIEATGVSLDQPIAFKNITLHTSGGYVYRAMQPTAVENTLLDAALQPMIPHRAPILIEVDPAHLAGGKLFLQTDFDVRLSAQARVDLELTEERADQLVADARRRYVLQGSS